VAFRPSRRNGDLPRSRHQPDTALGCRDGTGANGDRGAAHCGRRRVARAQRRIDRRDQADTVLLGLPLYNYGPPSTVKSWVDHIIALGLSIDAETHAGLLGDADFIVLASRGGGYGPGTPRDGWDHAQTWLLHAVSGTGLQPRFITAELTAADANPEMAHLKPLAAERLNTALAAIDQLWTADEDAA
jgi:FMN-dependent NADH-azoreductase